MNESWLKCKVSAGQFDSEAAVRGTDYRGDDFSLFVPMNSVHVDGDLNSDWVDGMVLVEVLESKDEYHLVYLPSPSFGNGRSITVKDSQLDERCPTPQ